MKLRKYTILFVTAGLFLIFLFAGISQRNRIQEYLRLQSIAGTRVDLPVLQNYQGKDKILVLVPDTGECANCRMHLAMWKLYMDDAKSKNKDCRLVFLLDKDMHLSIATDSLIRKFGFVKNNSLLDLICDKPELKNYSTYLLDGNNKVVLCGSPLDQLDFWNLYLESMQ